ncbi:MAG TPA: SURF1 family cytochrome oxidase biogenesis protein [Allosphingosinicella sp.]|jgi:cytochrome oxidase assembly protein ShyY1
MKRLPLIPTILVAAAVAIMIALGIWQLGRAREKDALQAQLAANARLPAMALPRVFDPTQTFRKASALCLQVTRWQPSGGKSASGQGGTRFIAECSTGAEGPGFLADMGVSLDPKAQPAWKGGEVSGVLVPEPGAGGLIAKLTGKGAVPRPMLVSNKPAPGLQPSAPPSLDSLTNNSRSYAVQWFFFAACAAVIYLLAVRRGKGGTLRQTPGDTNSPPQ